MSTQAIHGVLPYCRLPETWLIRLQVQTSWNDHPSALVTATALHLWCPRIMLERESVLWTKVWRRHGVLHVRLCTTLNKQCAVQWALTFSSSCSSLLTLPCAFERLLLLLKYKVSVRIVVTYHPDTLNWKHTPFLITSDCHHSFHTMSILIIGVFANIPETTWWSDWKAWCFS